MSSLPSPSQTIGPFPHESWRWAFMPPAAIDAAPVLITGHVFDGNGAPVSDAVVEAHSAAAVGWVSGMPGFQRVACDADGRFALAVPEQPTTDAPALLVTVFARGLLCQQFTAVWLAEGELAPRSSVLAQVPAARRNTLLARPDPVAGPGRYAWDVHLQGDRETVFFDFR